MIWFTKIVEILSDGNEKLKCKAFEFFEELVDYCSSPAFEECFVLIVISLFFK